MSFSNPVPYFLLSIAYLLLGATLCRGSAFYRSLLAADRHGKLGTIEGLRGFLALGVFFAHTATFYFLFRAGRWDASDAPFYSMTGQTGVALFFMITGFLFWGKVLDANGVLNVRQLYESRVRRIVPMYLVSVLMVLAVTAALGGFSLQVPLKELLRELRAWFSFGFIEADSLNGVRNAHAINAVYWTLAFEWSFYIALPFLALFARGRRFVLLCVLAAAYGIRTPVVLNFLFEALAAVAVRRIDLGALARDPRLAPIPLAALAVLFTGFDSAFGVLQASLLFTFFLFVAYGNSLFGLLSSDAARLIGTVSYSFYLIHCIVLFLVTRILDSLTPVAQLDLYEYWLAAGAAGAVAIVMSMLTYRWIEHFSTTRSRPSPATSAAAKPA